METWSSKQVQRAQALYGSVLDIPFPHIPPEADSIEVERMTEMYRKQILELSPKAVHLMGEMNFVFLLAQKLLADQISVLASTSRRKVQEIAQGKKETIFDFVQFRPYELLRHPHKLKHATQTQEKHRF